ncbi:MltR family transcriptional regulator [Pseudomonas tohonis]|uniref:MltR family transcriptional regulator n=1 Tax=Pseudomonas tohonis TaxID=2725477 RepID=UPI001F1A3D7E|nr:MltR family transcriptional regulator [Pseudomonas tohonis]
MSMNIAYESDRGCLIVAAALMDNLLEEIIKHHIKKYSTSKSLEKNLFDMSGPISNFSSKITICRSFGLIDETAYQDLMILRKLRNNFAHNEDEASFLADDVRQKIRSMHFVKLCMGDIDIKRYSLKPETGETQETNKCNESAINAKKMLKEWEYLAEGFLSYDKVMFCLALEDLAHHIKHYSAFQCPPPETISQAIKRIRKERHQTN